MDPDQNSANASLQGPHKTNSRVLDKQRQVRCNSLSIETPTMFMELSSNGDLRPGSASDNLDLDEKVIPCNKLLFPFRLRRLLDDADREGNQSIVSWLSHGTAFKVHEPREFASRIMRKYFRQTHFKSFTRQVSISALYTN
jgi:hypothetical protein